MQITDRSKDVIKSGGEWISSVELENELMAHPDVRRGGGDRQARRALGRAPLCCVVLREEPRRAPRSSSTHLSERVAKWWLPDEFAFVAEVPKTSVGKFDKKVLRGHLAEGTLEGRVRVSVAVFALGEARKRGWRGRKTADRKGGKSGRGR